MSSSKLAAALRKNRERSSKNFLPFYKFPEGKTDIRILPASKKDDAEDWFMPVGLHYNVEDKRPLTCPYETNWAEDPCPICELVQEMRSEGMAEDAQRMNVRRQYLVRGIVRGEEEKGVQILRLPSTLFTQIGEYIEDDDEYGDILSPGPKGRDIRVNKTGKGLDTKYSATPRIKPEIALKDKDELRKILDELEEITSLVNIPNYSELEKIVKEKVGYTASMGDSFDDDDADDDGDDDYDLDSGDDTDASVDPEEVDDFFDDRDDDDDDDDDDDTSWMDRDDDDDDFETDDDDDDVSPDLEEELATKHKVTKKRGKSRKAKKE